MIERNPHGFTLVELMLSTVAFSLLLLLVLTVFLQISRSYTAGQEVKNIQESSRHAFNSIATDIRTSDAEIINVRLPFNDVGEANDLPGLICLGSVKYAWNEFTVNPVLLDTDSDSQKADKLTDAMTQARIQKNRYFTDGSFRDRLDVPSPFSLMKFQDNRSCDDVTLQTDIDEHSAKADQLLPPSMVLHALDVVQIGPDNRSYKLIMTVASDNACLLDDEDATNTGCIPNYDDLTIYGRGAQCAATSYQYCNVTKLETIVHAR